MKKILLVTNKISNFSNFIESLKTEYGVESVGYINSARTFLKGNKYELIIIETKMPTLGLFTQNETQDGEITGIIWFEKELQSLDIPVVFWSWDESQKEIVEDLEKKYPDNMIGFCHRTTGEDHLLDYVNEFIAFVNNFLY